MPTLLTSLVTLALAAPQPQPGGDPPPRAVYRAALARIDEMALDTSACTPVRRREDIARQIEADLPWSRVETREGALRILEGNGSAWGLELPVEVPAEELLASLDAALRAAPRARDGYDPRVTLLRGLTRCLDRHSVVLADKGLARFDERMGGTLSGVGATIGREAGALRVKGLVEGGPAERAGLRVGDAIVSVGGISTAGMGVDDLTARIRGPAGTVAQLTIAREGVTWTLAVLREAISIRNVHLAAGPHDVDVVRIDHFSELTRGWLHEALLRRAATGRGRVPVVLDLRGNTGGSLLQSAEAADAFLDEGTIVTTHGRSDAPVRGLAPRLAAEAGSGVDGVDLSGVPVVVLVDAQTASGAEILAGALREQGRAIVVGTQTFGKGTVQKVYPLATGLKLKLTVAEYRVGDGLRVADVGIAPDVLVDRLRVEDGVVRRVDPRVDARAWDVPRVTMLAADTDGPLRLAARIARGAAEVGAWRRDDVLPVARQQASLAATWASADVARALAPLHGAAGDAGGLRPVHGAAGVTLTPLPRGEDGAAAVRVEVASGENGLDSGWIALGSDGGPWDGALLPTDALAPGTTRVWEVRLPQEDDLPAREDAVTVAWRGSDPRTIVLGTAPVPSGGTPAPVLSVWVGAREEAAGGVDLDLRVASNGDRVNDVTVGLPFPELEPPLNDLVEVSLAETPVLVAGAPGGGEARARLGVRWRGEGARPPLPLELRLRAGGHAWQLPFTLAAATHAEVGLTLPALEVQCGAGDSPCPSSTVGESLELVARAQDDSALASVALEVGPERVSRRSGARTVDVPWRRVGWEDVAGARAVTRRWTVPLAVGANHVRVVATDAQGLRQERTFVVVRVGAEPAAGGVTGGGQPPVP